LLGGQVDNRGLITARLGSVLLGAGDAATLDFNGDGLLSVALDAGAAHALVDNSGSLSADGFLRLTDRAKDVIKSGGEWISSVDLENAIMAHPEVVEASVVGVPDDRWGERPLASVVLRAGSSVTPEQLRDFLADRLARWQLPERWAIIDEVPKTSVGKFDKKVLRSRYADGDLDVQTLS
jgi:acyl-CoA synthetase (AMP-forming)/AMP-acid ligase II